MTRTLLLTLCAVGLATGCGDGARPMAEAVDISGTVTAADGKPVHDVMLTLRPKKEGHPASVALGADGKFSVKAVPGEFMFLFEPLPDTKTAKAKAGFAAVPAKYQDVSVDHTVTLTAGGANTITLK